MYSFMKGHSLRSLIVFSIIPHKQSHFCKVVIFFTNLKLQLQRCSVNVFFSCTLNTASLSEICWQRISHFYKLVIIGNQIFRSIFLLMVGEGRRKQICKICLTIVCPWVYSKRFERLYSVTWNHNAMWRIVCILVSFMSRQCNAT